MTTADVTSARFPHEENGKRIARARQLLPGRRGPLSQTDFAAELGVSERHFIRLENGERLPSAELRDRIVKKTRTKEEIAAFDDEDEEGRMRRLNDDLARMFHQNLAAAQAKRAAIGALVLAALALTASAQASPAGPLVPSMASRLATAVAGKPIVVLVDAASPGSGQTPVVGEPIIMLGKRVYRSAVEGGSYGLFILLHETGHATGIRDEHQADCFALRHFKRALRFFHLTKQAAHDRWLDALEVNRESLAGYGCAA